MPDPSTEARTHAKTGPVVHVTGARPNFPKAAPVIAALDKLGIEQLLVHTGQHYDEQMSEVFFRQLGLPKPDINLDVGSATHAVQTAAIMVGLENLFLARRPALVVVYGDVNSTVAAALVAAKLLIPVAHVEAGLRSFDMTMPEEVNRRLTDQLSDLLLVTSADAVGHLGNEGLPIDHIHFVGNPMIDTLIANLDRYDAEGARSSRGLVGPYAVATLHRPANVDSIEAATALVAALHGLADLLDLVLPLHPRGRTTLEAVGLLDHPRLHVEEPLGYVEFMGLVRGAALVLTDSGGVQEETTVLGVPCLTMRPNTERPITITDGTNRLVRPDQVVEAAREVLSRPPDERWPVPPLWDGRAGERIGRVIERWLAARGDAGG
jgi:UDP-N-acetylglucosamine 2-epimerase (non-hydrolysing)